VSAVCDVFTAFIRSYGNATYGRARRGSSEVMGRECALRIYIGRELFWLCFE
jgi:hypothetical protein